VGKNLGLRLSVDQTKERHEGEVEALLGHRPRGKYEVAVRGVDDQALVIRNSPFLFDGTPMPTLYWLIDPVLNRLVGQIESSGGVKLAESELDAVEIEEAHRRYERERNAMIDDGLVGPKPSGGVGGTRKGIKCLHAHYAYFLAGGDDPVGRWVESHLADT
jgi:uncharacterized protein